MFEIRLQNTQLYEAILRQIDRRIPYHILFVLICAGKEQAWIGYKEAVAAGNNISKVSRYFHTDWVPEGSLQFSIDGMDMDGIYAGLVRQIAGGTLSVKQGENIKQSVEWDEERTRLQKQIAKLEAKIRKERQLNRQIELNAELRKSQKKLEEFDVY